MTEGVEGNARTQVNDVAALLRLGQLPAQMPTSEGDTFTQVVTAGGQVVAATASLAGTRPISSGHPGEEGTVIHGLPAISGGPDPADDRSGPYLLLARTVPSPSRGLLTIYVAGSLRPVESATDTVGWALAGGVPVLLLLVAVLVWLFAGRALRPVEAIRAEVADITGRDLHRRVPEPRSLDEVAGLARTMNAMLDRLEASASTQRRFAADASHELRSPLTVVQATLEVALAHPERSDWPTVAAEALDELNRLHHLVEDLLALARAEAGERVDTEVDLDELVLLEVKRRRLGGGQVGIKLQGVSAGLVRGDPAQLSRVVRNLMDNAERHATSSVSVGLTTEDEAVVLVVSDDGPGIPPAERARVFEPFARLDEARSLDDGGSGLGLAIAGEIVSGHQGTIGVADSESGASLVVLLPAASGFD
ncbi:MAG: sensor histidine kinase, partial [Acidimicrobiales bacterium]